MFKRLHVFILIGVISHCLTQIHAQDKGLSFGGILATFNDINYHNFKPTIGFNIEYESGLLFGASFMKFIPRADTFFFRDNQSDIGYGTISYEDYFVIPVYAGKQFPIKLVKSFVFKPGLQFGYTYARYEYIYNDAIQYINDTYVGAKIGFAPRINLTYKTSTNCSVYINLKYNGMFEITGRSTDPVTGSASSTTHSVGKYHQYFTIGLGTTLNFN